MTRRQDGVSAQDASLCIGASLSLPPEVGGHECLRLRVVVLTQALRTALAQQPGHSLDQICWLSGLPVCRTFGTAQWARCCVQCLAHTC